MHKSVSMLSIAILAVTGCSTTQGIYPNYKPKSDADKAKFEAAVEECNSRAKAKYPKLIAYIPNGKVAVTPIKTNCSTYKNETSCTSSGGSPYADYDVIDENYPKRREYFYECLVPFGYK